MSHTFGKATLDLDKLVHSETITPDLAHRLVELREPNTATNTLVSVLYIIGALAAAAGVVLLKPTATTGLIIALVCLVLGQFILFKRWHHLDVLALALGIGSAAGLTGWFVLEFGDTLSALSVNSFATATTLLMAILFRSRFLAALVPLAIGAMIGSGGAYWHASYGIFVQEGAITAVLFTALAALLWWVFSRLRESDWGMMSLVAARMSFTIANFGFWVGSLWGDHVGEYFIVGDRRSSAVSYKEWAEARSLFRADSLFIHETVFALVWAAFSLVAIALGRKLGNRFLELAGIVFLAINAFTQYFEYFEDEPWALIFGGIALVALAIILVRYQMKPKTATV